MYHSDSGSQYLSIKYTERLAEAKIVPSVDRDGGHDDNALAEIINELHRPITYEDIAYDESSLNKVVLIPVTFSKDVGLNPTGMRNSDVYNRLFHASNHRWGRLIELIFHALAEIGVEHPNRKVVLI